VRLCDVCGDLAMIRASIEEHVSRYHTRDESYELDLCEPDANLLRDKAWGELGRRVSARHLRNTEQRLGPIPPENVAESGA
jgi:hypothetical protein